MEKRRRNGSSGRTRQTAREGGYRTKSEKNRRGEAGRSRAKQQKQTRRLVRRMRALVLRAAVLAIAIMLLVFIGGKLFHWFDGKGNANETAQIPEGVPVTETTEEAQAEQEPVIVQSVTLAMIGDVLLHDNLEKCCLLTSGSYDYSSFFANISSDIQNADLALVSQEIIVGGRDLGVTGYPDFNAPNEIADDLEDAGFNVILHASNHAYDKGEVGIRNCLSKWNKSYPNIAVLGIHDSAEASRIYYCEKNGIRFAILNFTYGVNGNSLPADKSYLVDLMEENQVRADIREAKTNADFVIVCPHWGTEYSTEIDANQKTWTTLFLDEGVDLVLGSHPHVIEPIRLLKDSASGHEMLVYYSVGNFVNWTQKSGDGTMNSFVGGLANVRIGRDSSGKVRIADYGVTALVCHITPQIGGVTVYRLSDYTEELARQNYLCNMDSTFSCESAKSLCDRVWGSTWK